MLHAKNSLTIVGNDTSRRAPGYEARSKPEPRGEGAPLVLIASAVAGLRKLWLEGMRGFTTVEISDYTELARIMEHRRPDVLFLDLQLPRLGGMSSVATLHRLRPATRIIVLASRPDAKEGIVALKMGARGYCDRSIAPALLARALEAVQRGEVWIGRKLTSQLIDELSALTEARLQTTAPLDVSGRLHRLTSREHEIVVLLGVGASNKEIAQRLGVTERTVKAHLTAVFRKLGISGRLQAALLVVEQGRTNPTPEGVRRRFN